MPKHQHRPLSPPATLFALLLSVLWSGQPIATKAGLYDAPALRLGWMRFVAGGIVVIAWAIYTKADLRPQRADWLPMLGLGMLFSVQVAFMNIGLSMTTAGHGGILTLTFPIWVAVLANFFVPGDRLTRDKILGILISYGGILVIFADSLDLNRNLLLGDLFSLTSGFLLGARLVYTARVVQNLHPAKLLLAQAIFGTVIFVLASAIFEGDPYILTQRLAISIFYQGVIIAGFCFIGNLWLIKQFFPSQVSVLHLTQPVFSILAARVFLNEPFTHMLWLSALLVILGAILVQRQGGKARDRVAG